MHAAQIKPEEPEGFALQRVDHFGLLAVELDPQDFQLLLQTLQGTFGPAPLAPRGHQAPTVEPEAWRLHRSRGCAVH